jgi:hypothetical protein
MIALDKAIDKEMEKYSGDLLTLIADINPVVSKQITAKVKKSEQLRKNKTLRKLTKVAIFYCEHLSIYQEAAKTLNRLPEWSTQVSNPKISIIYESIYKLYSQERISGSIESKYEKKYK